jgi:SEC10/PgrA surface exclusion-like protein/LPXTG-motif cell wall-anchored protein
MEDIGKVSRRYAKYGVTSLAISAALLAVNPSEVNAEEVEETVEDVDAQLELAEESVINEEAAQARGEEVLEAEEEIDAQEEVVEEAQNTVDENQENVDQVEEDLATVETEAEEIEQEINDLEEDANSVNELEQSIVEDEAEAALLEEEIAETETEQEATQNEVNDLKEDVETIQQTVEEEEATLNDLQEERDRLAEAGDQTPVLENEIVLPDGYLEALDNYHEIENPTAADNAAMEEVARPGVALNGYESQAEDQAVEIEDPTNLDNEIAIELAHFTADLLNPIRSALGNEPLVPNQDAINMASEIADTYERDGHNPFEDNGHHVAGIEEVAGEYGLNQGQFYENLGTISGVSGTTLDDLKQNIYDTLVLMLFEDAHANYGHALSLVGELNGGITGFLGVAFSYVPAENQAFDSYNTHFITVPDSAVYLQGSTEFDVTANPPYVEGAPSEEVAELDRQIEEQRAVVEAEQARLSEREEALTVSRDNLALVTQSLEDLQNELNAVNTRLDEQRVRLDELENVDSLVNGLEEQLADKEAERDELRAVYSAAQADLEEAQANLADEQEVLAQLQTELEALKQEPYSFEAERTEEVAYETEYVYTPDLLEGTEEVSQEGVEGLVWLLEHVVYLDDEEIDRLVVSSEVLAESVPEIIQVGTGVAEDEDLVMPEELEQRIAELDEALNGLEIENEDLLAEQNVLRQLVASLETDLEADAAEIEALEQRVAELEVRSAALEAEAPANSDDPEETVEADDSDDVEGVGTTVAASENNTEELPQTGAGASSTSLVAGIASLISGLGLMIFPKRKRK